MISSVAAVSAYEAHAVNVTATVENALNVSPAAIDFGEHLIGSTSTIGHVFPEEWLTKTFTVDPSESFKQQARVTLVEWEVCAEHKQLDPNDASVGFFKWLGEALYVSDDGSATYKYVGAPTSGQIPTAKCIGLFGTATNAVGSTTYTLGMDVPVFAGFYNPLTDVPDKPRPPAADAAAGIGAGIPSQIITPSGICQPTECALGVDIKIQVICIGKPANQAWLDAGNSGSLNDCVPSHDSDFNLL